MGDFNNMGVDLGKFWGEEFESDEIFKIRSRNMPVLDPRRSEINDFKRKKLLCKVEFTLLKSKFLPAKFSFSKIQEKNSTLQRSEVHFKIYSIWVDLE
jgi:hypothetical protein